MVNVARAFLILALLAQPAPAQTIGARENGGVSIGPVTYDIESNYAIDDLIRAVKLSFLDSDWLLLDEEADALVAEITVRGKHYVKVRATLNNKKIEFTLLDMSDDIDKGRCIYRIKGKPYVGDCIHSAYYEWIESVVARIPVSEQKIELIRSLQ